MVEFLCVRKLEKRNRSNGYWRIVKVCVGSIRYEGLKHFDEECVDSIQSKRGRGFGTFESIRIFLIKNSA